MAIHININKTAFNINIEDRTAFKASINGITYTTTIATMLIHSRLAIPLESTVFTSLISLYLYIESNVFKLMDALIHFRSLRTPLCRTLKLIHETRSDTCFIYIKGH